MNENQDQTEDVIKKIHQHLKDRRCLIVLDDVWHRDVLEKIGLPLEKESKMKILLMTHNRKVAESMSPPYDIQTLESLSSEDNMKLF